MGTSGNAMWVRLWLLAEVMAFYRRARSGDDARVSLDVMVGHSAPMTGEDLSVFFLDAVRVERGRVGTVSNMGKLDALRKADCVAASRKVPADMVVAERCSAS